MSERLVVHDATMPRPLARGLAFALVLTGILVAAAVLADGLRFAPVEDEEHFLETAQQLARDFPPSLEALRSYEEVITPFAFLFWAGLERWTGDAAFAGRLFNLALVAAIVCGIALRRGRPSDEGLLAALGVLAFPYLLGLGVHLYTDVPAAFLALMGVRAHLRGRTGTGVVLLCLAIATRQYLVAVPVGLAAWEWSRSARGEARRWLGGAAAALAAASLLGWFAFFGGLAPQAGIERWLTKYPAPMQEPGYFIVEYGLYFLTALACYFVLPEMLLFRQRIRWQALATRRNGWIALGLGLLFLFFPPAFDTWNGGALDRTWQLVFPRGAGIGPRMVVYYGLALITCIRFGRRLDLAFWIVAVHLLILTQTQLPWDKYFMPAIVLLWFLKAEGMLNDGFLSPPRTPESSRDDPPSLRIETGLPAPAIQ